MKMEFQGLEQLMEQLSHTGTDMKHAENEILAEGAKVIQEEVRKHVKVRRGVLKRHIEISDPKDGEISVYVDNQGKAFHGYILEFGRRAGRSRKGRSYPGMPAYPFMGPGFNNSRFRTQGKMAEAIRRRLGWQ